MILQLIVGTILVGLAYRTDDSYSIIYLIEGIVLLNMAIFNRTSKIRRSLNDI